MATLRRFSITGDFSGNAKGAHYIAEFRIYPANSCKNGVITGINLLELMTDRVSHIISW